MEGFIHKISRYAGKILLAALMITTLSCERDVFLTEGDGKYDPRPVSLTIAYELPEHEQNTVTRSISANDEYKLNNFYLMIFANDEQNSYPCVFKKYFDMTGGEILDPNTFSSEQGDFVSIENKYRNHNDNVNTTSGFVTVDMEIDPTKGCYIYGFANVEPLPGDTQYQTIDAMAVDGNNLITPRAKLDKIYTLDELKEMKVDVSFNSETSIDNETIAPKEVINRENPNLLYSGQWSTWLDKIDGEDGKKHIVFDEEALTGFVGPGVFTASQSGNNYDLRTQGMIYLRTTIAHIRFNITYDPTIFSDFKPESWQVVHAPMRSYYIDNGRGRSLYDEVDFGKVEPNKRMLQDNANFSFDFYMMENIKNARSTSNIDISDDDEHAGEKSRIISYYDGYFGETVNNNTTKPDGIENSDGYLSKQNLIYMSIYRDKNPSGTYTEEYLNRKYYDDEGEIAEAIRYAKREMELKHTSDYMLDPSVQHTAKDQIIWNKAGEQRHNLEGTYKYNSKKYVYSEPKATYVIIKGRLLLRDGVHGSKNLLEPDYDATGKLIGTHAGSDLNIKNAYADVSYTIHLGYTKETPLPGETWNQKRYDPTDFSIFRNAEYTYNVHIAGINSIITNVLSTKTLYQNKDAENKEFFRVKPQTNAEGLLSLSMNKVYDTDAHFNQFNIMLEKEGLSDFYFEIHTPWSVITSDEVKDDIDWMKRVFGATDPTDPNYAANYGAFVLNYKTDSRTKARYEKYLKNPDFTWFKFTPALDQRGIFDDETKWREPDREENYTKLRKTVKYDMTSPTMWNLFDFMVSMDGLSASDDQRPLYNEASEAIRIRINNVLYGNDEGDKASSQTVFECEVADDNGNYAYTRSDVSGANKRGYSKASGTALPFLLDRYKYQLEKGVTGDEEPDVQYNTLLSLYNANKYKRHGESGYYHKFKRPYIIYKSDGVTPDKYMVEEDYVQYLKETDPLCFGDNNQIAPIRRMFYTVYLDEYFYSTPPTGQTWSAPYWKQFANQPSRYVNFGYKGEGYAGEVGTQYSSDGQSSLIYSAITIVQPSIQTFYSTTSSESTYALGVEHTNETIDPRWKNNPNDISSSDLKHDDGWLNCKKYISGNDGSGIPGLWDKYVSEYVYDYPANGIQNNVTMKWTEITLDENDRKGRAGLDNKLAYYAGAVRMCLSRNRDENNDGMIDASELKWYLPSSDQMDVISLCHFSLYDPLFDHNKFFREEYSLDVDHQRLPESSLQGQFLYKYHFVTSDYNVFEAEEFMNSSGYGTATTETSSHPYDMRCVRNLNVNPKDNTIPKKADGSNADDVKIYVYTDNGESLDDEGNTIHIRTFEMGKLDHRSIRSLIYRGQELPSPHYVFSTDNLPYYKFQIASKNDLLKSIIDNLQPDQSVNPEITDNVKKVLKYISHKDVRPCQYYWEKSRDEIGSWRAPNAAEMGLMMMELRHQQPNDYTYSDSYPELDTDNPVFFWGNGQQVYYPFSSSSWNFTGPWGRVMGVKKGSHGWDIFLSNIKDGWDNKPYTTDFSDLTEAPSTNYIVRCVRDIAN